MAVASTAAAGAATAGTVMSATAAAKNANAQAAQDATNERYAYEAARNTEQQGEVDAARVQMQGTQLESSQKAAFAANGIDLSSGTVGDTLAQTARFTELDAENIRRNAALNARGYRQQGLQYGAQGQLALTAGRQQVAGSIIGGVGQVTSDVANAFAQGAKANAYGANPGYYGAPLPRVTT